MSPAGEGTVRSATAPTVAGRGGGTARSRITARSCGPVIVSTRGKYRLSAGSSSAICASRLTRIATRGPVVGLPGFAGQQVDVEVEVELVRIGERQQRFADRGAVRGLTATDTGGNRGTEPAGDLLQVDHIRPVEDGEVHHQTGGPVQLVQEWLRGAVQPILMHRERSQLDQSHAPLIVASVAAEPAQLHQPFEHPVRRGAWQAGAAYDLSQREPARSVESVQDQRNAIDDGARRTGIGLALHGSS